MNSKEAKLIEELNKCDTTKSYENVRYTLIDDELRAYIEESLERLEKLEKENNCIEKEMYLLIDERDELDLKNFDLSQQNEKLKKKLDIYQKYTGVYYDEETKKNYIAIDCDFGCKGDVITKEEFEVLGE